MKTDIEVQKDVMAELEWEPGLKNTQIGVSVTKGIVMLSGVVDSYYKKVLAEKATRKVSGVKAVAEEIVVQVPGGITFTDVDIANAIVNTLKWNCKVNEKEILVKVEDAEVTLEGAVEWNFQKISVQKAVESLIGVRNIINNIRVQNKITAMDIKEKISEAFQRSSTLDSDKLNVDVLGNKVILTGSVWSYSEKMDAEKIAWSSPGVMYVDNHLIIETGL